MALGDIIKVVTAPVTGGLSLATGGGGGVSDLLFGKKVGPDPIAADISRVQAQALGIQGRGLEELGDLLKEDPRKIAAAQAAREQRQLRGGLDDALRRAQSLVARRGLQNTSVGLAQETGLTRDFAERQGQIQASIPERIRNLRLQRAQSALGGASGVLASQNVPVRFREERTGGISGLLGAGLGGFIGSKFGSPGGGAAAGAGVGNALSGIFG